MRIVEEFCKKFITFFSHPFDEAHAVIVYGLLHIGRNWDFNDFSSVVSFFPNESFVFYQIDNANEIFFGTDRHLNWDCIGS